MVQGVWAALIQLTALLVVKAHCKEARHILCGLAAVAAVFPALAELPPVAQCLLALEARAARVQRERPVTAQAAVALADTTVLAVRVTPQAATARLLVPGLVAVVAVRLVIPAPLAAAAAAALASSALT